MSATLLSAWENTVRAAPGAVALIDASTGQSFTRAQLDAEGDAWRVAHGCDLADRAVVFHAAVDPDAHVAKGARIGTVTDYLNRPLQEITASEAGVVMFIRAVPSLKKGDTIVNIGVVSTHAR